jgi:hypothetical protein
MPKVTKIKKAGKDYPQFGIKKGDAHFVWAIKMQRGGILIAGPRPIRARASSP